MISQTSDKDCMTGYPSIDKPWLKYYPEEAINEPLPECSIYEYLWENNKEHLDDIAIIYFKKEITYGKLFDNIDRAASAFSKLGVKKGDIVSFIAITTPEIIYSFYAINKLGAIANMIDPRMAKSTMIELIHQTNSKLLITLDIFANDNCLVLEDCFIKDVVCIRMSNEMSSIYKVLMNLKGKIVIPQNEKIIEWSSLIRINTDNIAVDHDCYSSALIEYTGGTTGEPKGVVLSNLNVNSVVEQYKRTGIEFIRGNVWQCVSAPFIAYVWVISMHCPLSFGIKCKIVIYDPKTIAENIINDKFNHVAANPLVWETVMKHPKAQKKDFSHLIVPSTGADYMSPKLELELNNFLQEHKCKYKICQGYGMTEVGTAVSVCISNEINRLSSVGIPFVKTVISAFDIETQQELEYGKTGEICISGPTIMSGYLNNKEETENVLKLHSDGNVGLHLADLGHIDSDGFIYIDGRLKRMIIKYNGAKVFPPIIEQILLNQPEIKKCSVVGIKDKNNSIGMEPIAFIVINKDCDKQKVKEELRILCQKELPDYAQPIDFLFINEMPFTAIGKVDYRALEKMAEEMENESE